MNDAHNHGTCGYPPCTCPVGADECDGEYGMFMPGSKFGDVVVRPCKKINAS